MKKLILGSFIALTFALLGWGATDNVNAVSDWDNAYRTYDVSPDDDSFLVNTACPSTGRISWNEIITQVMSDSVSGVPSNFSDRIFEADTNPDTQGWYVSYQEWSDGATRVFIGVYNTSRTLSWTNDSGLRQVRINISAGYGRFFGISCSDVLTDTGSFSGNQIISNEPNANINTFNYFVSGPVDFNYPADYEGDSVVPDPNISTLDVYPIIGITIKDPVDILSDIFITAESRTWESRGLPPPDFTVITLEDSDNNIIITDGCFNAGRYCDYKKLPFGIYTAYLDIIYTDSDITNSYNFKTTKFVFEIHNKGYTILYHPDDDVYCSVMDGTEWNCHITQPDNPEKETVTGFGGPLDWYECIVPDFPFIDIESCTKNVYQIINMLSFDVIQFSNNWTTSGCHTLGTVGEWLNLENSARTVCPQFSSTVRNIITPFITFFLATVTISFVVKKSEGEL